MIALVTIKEELIICSPLNIFEPVVANVLKSTVPTLPLITLNDCEIDIATSVKLVTAN